MAETRTFDPGDSEGIQKLVREALGETTRPFTPGDESFRTEQVEPEEPGADQITAVKADQLRPEWLAGGGGGGW